MRTSQIAVAATLFVFAALRRGGSGHPRGRCYPSEYVDPRGQSTPRVNRWRELFPRRRGCRPPGALQPADLPGDGLRRRGPSPRDRELCGSDAGLLPDEGDQSQLSAEGSCGRARHDVARHDVRATQVAQEPQPQPVAIQDGHITWPSALQKDAFASDREVVEEVVVRYGDWTSASESDRTRLAQARQAMLAQLRQRVHECSPQEYVNARRFLVSLPDSLGS